MPPPFDSCFMVFASCLCCFKSRLTSCTVSTTGRGKGDTDFVKVPTSQLILKSYASEFRKRFNPEKASDSLALPARVLPASEATETTHFSVVDKDGNAVANTYTLNGGYGSGVAIEGTGILMNNEMDDFTSSPEFQMPMD